MSMKTLNVKIKGKSALLMHRFPMEEIKGIEKMKKEQQAEISAYRVPGSKELYIPAVALQRCLVNAAVYTKGRGRASMQKPVAACVIVTPEYLELGQTQYEIDSRPIVNPSTKGRIIRHRPRLDEWEVSCVVEYDPLLVSEDEMRAIFDDAGSRVGLLDYRPEKKGPFGRFMVTQWEEIELDEEVAA